MTTKILIIEDDHDLQDFLKQLLADHGYTFIATSSGSSALNVVKKSAVDLVILDLGLPDIDGKTICTTIKDLYPNLPIIILTAKGTTEDIVQGLNLGADDYIPKPFVGEELVARIKARLRHNRGSKTRYQVVDLELDTETFTVTRNKKTIPLTKTEFRLLEYLIINKNRVLNREMILNNVWSYSADVESRVVDVFIGYLREKIDKDFTKKLIQSVRGFGYIIKDE